MNNDAINARILKIQTAVFLSWRRNSIRVSWLFLLFLRLLALQRQQEIQSHIITVVCIDKQMASA